MKEAENHYNLALDLIERGLIDEAIKELREAIRIEPELSDAHWVLGRALAWEGNIDEGIEELKKAIKIDPECIGAHFYLGDAYDQNGKTDEAIKEFREVIRINPEFPYAYYSLGISLGNKGLFKEATKSFETYLKYAPPEDKETVNILKNRLSLMKLIAGYVNSDETREQDAYAVYETIKDLSEEDSEKIVDKKLAMEIIATALSVATKGKIEIEKITDIPPETDTMTAEKIQKLGITKESLLGAFLSDPRVISAECKDGEFHIETVEGKLSFNFKFEDEKTSGSA